MTPEALERLARARENRPLTGFRPGLGFGFRFSAAAWVSGFAHSAAGFRVSGFGLVGLHNQPGARGRAPQDKFE